MKLIILPGNSGKNQDWVHEVATELSPLFDGVEIQGYDHWQTDDELIDLDRELAKLIDLSSNHLGFGFLGNQPELC